MYLYIYFIFTGNYTSVPNVDLSLINIDISNAYFFGHLWFFGLKKIYVWEISKKYPVQNFR